VNNLEISAPVGSSNLLLLNYSGYTTPFHVTDTLTVSSNCALLSLGSALRVGDLTHGQFVIDGMAAQGDYSDVAARTFWLGGSAAGSYQMSNGWLYANSLIVGSTNFPNFGRSPATFVQHGGTNVVTRFSLQPHSVFTLDGGTIEAFELAVGEGFPGIQGYHQRAGDPLLVQFAGDVVVERDVVIGRGRYAVGYYTLQSGSLVAERLRLGVNRYTSGRFQQYGGTVEVRQLSISEESYPPLALGESYTYSSYMLSNGTIRTFGTMVGAGRAGTFWQHGGEHIVEGGLSVTYGTDWSSYILEGGNVSCWWLTSQGGRFYQSGGTNEVATSLLLTGPSTFQLSGGRLVSDYTDVDSVILGTAFTQSGGSHISARLRVGASYELSGGELRTSEMQLAGTFRHRGGTVNADTITFLGGKWISEVTNQDFGVANFVSGTLALAAGASHLTFAEGSDVSTWDGTALTIEGWNGDVTGGGQHQVGFRGGIAPRAVGHICFKDPAGFAAGIYAARVLPTGEVVPSLNPTLGYTRYTAQTVLSWNGNFILQAATNVSGPYEDVPDATSPYFLNGYDQPQQFFRLRRQ
jgi:hypothetical protein